MSNLHISRCVCSRTILHTTCLLFLVQMWHGGICSIWSRGRPNILPSRTTTGGCRTVLVSGLTRPLVLVCWMLTNLWRLLTLTRGELYHKNTFVLLFQLMKHLSQCKWCQSNIDLSHSIYFSCLWYSSPWVIFQLIQRFAIPWLATI